MLTLSRLVLLAALPLAYAVPPTDIIRLLGPQGVNLWRLDKASRKASSVADNVQAPVAHNNHAQITFGSPGFDNDDAVTSSSQYPEFPDQWFNQPVDHFSNDSATFAQRYWVNARHYTPGAGGPVIVLDGGETSGEDRLPFLDTGIVEILTRVTGGVGVVLEHRYYGKSIPVPNFSTDNLRWLNNAQAAADSANFMATVKFDGIDEDLTAPEVPWIYYGGSYAGARAAHMRVMYPELVFGAIASSAVTHASLSNWEYMEIIRTAADPTCSRHLENSIRTIDHLLSMPHTRHAIKALFALGGLEHDEDFASLLEGPLGAWQSKNWDPAVNSEGFDEFCEALNKPILGKVHVAELPYEHEDRMVDLSEILPGLAVDFSIFNYAKYIRENYVSRCETNVEECFGTYDDSKFQGTSLDEDWRLWLFQVCTEWGYFSTAPPDEDQPRIVSKLLTLEYESRICQQAYPPGKHMVVPPMPNVTVVNELGDFAIAADRLAIIDGEVDPWRPCTPHSEYAADREDTLMRPFKLIPNGVHHYDEYGLKSLENEPPEIRQIHGEMIAFVMEWLNNFDLSKNE
ncbi:peptidase S28 [Coniophora puteana RWD-64-598 SS2]|uniref:Peptidase S28 n=1 Tax=Coniophora puteana (strain RWD-64-598) TaxID=741705 RepID=A0A5M3MRM6_CONPW|nr:peptidase S28 [Coniophora puteana RWD-64-598 SS2]EIW81201.1 peptidase S28 [Coniophora puteana RWD-64-598 SS2]